MMFTAIEHQIAQRVNNVITDICELYDIPKHRLYEVLSEFFSIESKKLKEEADKPKPWMSQKGFKDYFNKQLTD